MQKSETSKFSLGKCRVTPAALVALEASGQTAAIFLLRHVEGDWGEMDEEDRAVNEAALLQERETGEGGRLFSSYRTGDGETLWIITEADRDSTTVLVPDDY